MERVYLTNSNFKALLNSFKINGVEYEFIIKEIGEGFDEGELFSPFEKNKILLKKNMILNYKEFYEKNKEILDSDRSKISKRDSYKLYNSSPAYHKDIECEYLKKDYENFTIDENLPVNQLEEYKKWLKENESMYHENFSTFNLIHVKKWGENIEVAKYEHKDNSGTKEVELDGIDELKQKINELYKNKVEDKDKREFKKTIKWSYLANEEDYKIEKYIVIKYKSVIKEIHDLKMKIIDYLLTKYMNETTMKDREICNVSILKRVGFKACSCCNK